jgi:hypothetical protein
LLDIIQEILKIYGITGGVLITLLIVYRIIFVLRTKAANGNGNGKSMNDIWIEIKEQHAENNLYFKAMIEEQKGLREALRTVSDKLDNINETLRDAKNAMGRVEKIYTKR